MFKSHWESVKCSSRLGEAPRGLRCAPYACGTGFAEFYAMRNKNMTPREWAHAHGFARIHRILR